MTNKQRSLLEEGSKEWQPTKRTVLCTFPQMTRTAGSCARPTSSACTVPVPRPGTAFQEFFTRYYHRDRRNRMLLHFTHTKSHVNY